MFKLFNFLFLLLLVNFTWANPLTAVNKAKLPDNLVIKIFYEGFVQPRSIDVSNEGHIAIGSKDTSILILVDINGDGSKYKTKEFSGFSSPTGVVWDGVNLYIADINGIYFIDDLVAKIITDVPVEIDTVYQGLFNSRHHGYRIIDINQKGELYISTGVPCNICIPPPKTGEINLVDIENQKLITYASGLRNSVGFDFHPITGELWATDNGRDWLGDESPHDELNHIPTPNLHFGYPYCHDVDVIDPEFGEADSCSKYVAPKLKLGPHVASLGLHFLESASILPANTALVALHGSWNRSERIGYSVKKISFSADGQEVVSYEEFVEGWLDKNGTYYARPVDIAELKDGSILISDDANNAIYRISKKK